MRVRVVIQDTGSEEQFMLTADLSDRRADHLRWLAERVAQGTGWDVTISVEPMAQPG